MSFFNVICEIHISKLSIGLLIISIPLVIICVYISVVLLLSWPNSDGYGVNLCRYPKDD